MSITNITRPADWARVYDTNRMIYKFSSTNKSQPNFQYQFNMKVYSISGIITDLGSYNLHAAADGTVEFNPSEIYKSYIQQEINLSTTNLRECTSMALKFQLYCYEFYGTPPTKKTAGNWYESTPLNVYIGAQQNIPYDYIGLNPKGNSKWVMSGVTANQGQFLTDATEFRVDNTDYAFLYALGQGTNGRPTKIRYTIKYWGYSTAANPDAMFRNNMTPNLQQAMPNATPNTNLNSGAQITPEGTWGFLTATEYDTNVSFSYTNSLAYYFPCGPKQAISYSSVLAAYQNTWVYYDVDIMDAAGTVLNTYPVRFIRKDVCSKYGAWQMFWLNPHGGFDRFTFDKKNSLDYKIERNTYKIKLPPTYSTYDAGERVFNTELTEELTLRTRSLSQQEAQLITQMVYSPVVYSLITYNYGGAEYPYGVPYIVETDTFKLQQKVNDKEIFCEVKVRPANQKIIQRN